MAFLEIITDNSVWRPYHVILLEGMTIRDDQCVMVKRNGEV